MPNKKLVEPGKPHNGSCECCGRHPQGISRKDFIKKAGIGLGLAPLAALSLPSSDPFGLGSASSRVKKITLLHTSDIHGQVHPHDEFFWEGGPVFRKRGGFAHLSTLVKEIRKENPNTLLLDGGDCFQGSGLAALSEGQAMIPLMNHMKYDLILPGNWEVVYGKQMLMKDMSMYTARKVCSNMVHSETGQLMFPPSQVFVLDGIRIGFVGYNDPLTSQRQPPAFSRGIAFSHPEQNLREHIRHLKTAQRCDIVIAMTHMGMLQQVFLSEQPYAEGLDYILGADTHERIRQPLAGRYARVTEPGSFLSFVGRLDLMIEHGKIVDESYTLIETDPQRYPADKEMAMQIRKAEEPYREKINKVVGSTKTVLQRYYVIETPMDNLITDAILWKTGTDIALSSGYRFCPPLVPAETGTADITLDFLYSMLPVNTEIRIGKVSGEQIWNWLELELEHVFAKEASHRFGGWLVRFQGMKIVFTIGNDHGKRLEQVRIGGQALDPVREYTISSCERPGDPENVLCRMKEVKESYKTGYTLHEVMESYLAVHSPVSPVLEGRAVATDAPATLLTQVSGIDYQFR